MGMRFPKLNMKGLIKAPTGLLPKEGSTPSVPSPIKPLPSEVSKFTGLKRTLAKEKNNMKKYKI
jgi:hypothetical protein